MEALKKYFHFDQFRSSQESIINALLGKEDTLAIMPTGGGKSLCYQLPALLLQGVTLVVSPLISLMQDQVQALLARGIPATMINSALSYQEQKDRIFNITTGAYCLVYIAPERFRSESFLAAIKQVRVSLFAVDEAHCISQWGHDFRPDYTRLKKVIEALGRPVVGAFTATATEKVRRDIVEYLGLRKPAVFISGFARPNLELRVLQVKKEAQKWAHLSDLIESHGRGIIYCATRKRVEEVCGQVQSYNIACVGYHGGMGDEERKQVQNQFIGGQADVVVATNAFGMGIDRPDIRFVAHFEMPGSVEAYYQEVGRAGRDGDSATCELYFNYADKRIQEFFIEGSNPSLSLIEDLYSLLYRESDDRGCVYLTIQQMSDLLKGPKNTMAVSSALAWLQRALVIERFDIPGERMRATRLLNPSMKLGELPINAGMLQEKQAADREQLDAMIRFAYAQECRQQWILAYFGEMHGAPCGRCDVCLEKKGTKGSLLKRAPTQQEQLIVQKALSGIARLSCRSASGDRLGRFGPYKIILMLIGSKRSEVIESRLHEVSTYGLLKLQGKLYLQALFQELEKASIIQLSGDSFKLVSLTEKGWAIMQGSIDYALVWPTMKASSSKAKEGQARSDPQDVTLDIDEELLGLLKKQRRELAKGRPAYTVLTDKTLRYLAAHKPITQEEALQIPGIGPYKAKTVLGDFLKVIQNQRIRDLVRVDT